MDLRREEARISFWDRSLLVWTTAAITLTIPMTNPSHCARAGMRPPTLESIAATYRRCLAPALLAARTEALVFRAELKSSV